MVTRMKKANNFQIAKVQPQGVDYILLGFSTISTWRSLLIKVVLIKESVYITLMGKKTKLVGKSTSVLLCIPSFKFGRHSL